MTLKQKKFLQELSKNNYNISKTAKKVGYSESYSNSRIYQTVSNCKKLKEIFSEDNVKNEIEEAKKKFIKDNDNNNYARMIELKSKISIPELRKQEITHTNPDKIIIAYKSSDEKIIKDNELPTSNLSLTENINDIKK